MNNFILGIISIVFCVFMTACGSYSQRLIEPNTATEDIRFPKKPQKLLPLAEDPPTKKQNEIKTSEKPSALSTMPVQVKKNVNIPTKPSKHMTKLKPIEPISVKPKSVKPKLVESKLVKPKSVEPKLVRPEPEKIVERDLTPDKVGIVSASPAPVTRIEPDKVVPKQRVSTKSGHVEKVERKTAKQPFNGAVQGTISLLGEDNAPIVAENVIVSVTPLETTLLQPRNAKVFEIAMKKKRYVPSHLVVQTGDIVRFKNYDKLKHNVFSSSAGNRFDLGTFALGEKPGFVFQNNGLVKVYCNLHKRMSSFIQVMQVDRSFVTKTDGFFFIGDLPPGRYQLKAWDIRGQSIRPLQISAGNTINIDITLDGSSYIPKTRAKKQGFYPPKPVKIFNSENYNQQPIEDDSSYEEF